MGRARYAFEGLDVAGQDGMHAVLTLHHAVDDQDRLAVGDLAVAVVDVGLDRHVDLAELVFEGEEPDLLRRRRSLPGDDQPGDADSGNDYVRSDSAALPFADGSFDLAVFYNSLMDFDDMEAALQEAARVLRPRGALCACVTHPFADAGRFESRDANAPFLVEGTYLGPRRWLQLLPAQRGALSMDFSGWAYPLEAYFRALESAGFMVQALREPAAGDDHRWRRIPLYVMWRAVKNA